MMRRSPLAAALLAACSPGSAPPAQGNVQEVRAEPAAAPARDAGKAATARPRTSGEMQREAIAAEPPPAPSGEVVRARRCGWLTNPTPGNWWLFDGHGEWILSTQGGEQVPGFDELPDMSTAGWVETNGHYGYGCACMTISHDPATQRVTRVAAAAPKPLRQCRADLALPRP